MNFNIEKEVREYNTKKNKLTEKFVKRMQSIINSKRTAINQTQSTISELNKKIDQDQLIITQAYNAKENI